jgi:hypothetical protein
VTRPAEALALTRPKGITQMVKVRFMSLSGPFRTVREETFASDSAALEAVKKYAAAAGFTNVSCLDDDDPCSVRYTARTPGGRSGRNIAFADSDDCCPW